MFICFDGLDGCGKSTLLNSLKNNINNKDLNSVIINQPSDSYIGTAARYLLNHPQVFEGEKHFDLAISFLACADRLSLLNTVYSSSDTYYLVSRYILSTLAYGCFDLDNSDGSYLKSVCGYFPAPDFYFYIDICPVSALQRIQNRASSSDCYENLNKLGITYRNFKKAIQYLQNKGWNIYCLDGTKPIQELTDEVLSILELN